MQNQLQELIASFYQLEYGSEAYNQAATKKQYLEEEIASATTQWESLQTELDTLQK
jgi:septation ring formation regulator EzrA